MPKKRVSQDNPLVKVVHDSWRGCIICGAAHQGRVYNSHKGDCCIPCHYGKGPPVQPEPPDDREARELRLEALCRKFGVPINTQRPLREQLLVKALLLKNPMWSRSLRQPGDDFEEDAA